MTVKQKRWLEFGLLFAALPALGALLAFLGHPLPLIPLLWVLAACCLVALLTDKNFDRRSLVRMEGLGKAVRDRMPRFLVLAGAMTAMVVIVNYKLLFELLRHDPLLWLLIVILYPVLSVVPQAIVYRAFIFHRYRVLAGSGWGLVLLSTAAFCLAHLPFLNWQALVLTLVGGVIFGRTYQRTGRLSASTVEHALYGDFVFTIGLGSYLYIGTTQFLRHAVGG